MAEVRYTTDTKLITCVLPKGRALSLHRYLIDEQGIQSGTYHHGRGVGRDSIRDRGIGEQQERDVLEVVVPADRADELFEAMFFAASMDEPHGGFIYMTAMPRSTAMQLPDVPAEK